MSADNWAYCPRCQKEEDRNLRDEYERPEFREDYEIYGAESGTVCISYSGRCNSCGLSVSWEDSHPIEGAS